MVPGHRQRSYAVRVDWGLEGAKAVAEAADVAVVVDVLSFTTTLSVALDAGTAVLPYRWNEESASPNGSTISHHLASATHVCLGASLALRPRRDERRRWRTGASPAVFALD